MGRIRKKMEPRSEVWKHFGKYKKDGNDWAKCKRCGKDFYASTTKAGTSTLRTHFLCCIKKKLPLNRLDTVKMDIKHCCSTVQQFTKSINATDITVVYNQEKEKLRTYFKELCCRLSLMIVGDVDGTTSKKYFSFSVHFIDDDWKLNDKFICLKCTEGGGTSMKIIENVLSEWGIDNKISYMVLDGYSFQHILSPDERENGVISSQGSLHPTGKLLCIRDFHCMSSYCIRKIEKVLRRRMSTIFNCIKENKFRTTLDKKVTTGVINKDYSVVDLVGIALSQREALFESEKMLEKKDTKFKSVNLTKEEWDLITTFGETEDQEIIWYDYKTANLYFPWLCRRYMICNEFLKHEISKPLKENRLQCIKDGVKCWYDDNLVLAVAAVLDPRLKMDIVKHWYEEIYGGEWETRLATFKGYLTSVYDEYAEHPRKPCKMLDPSWKPCKCSHDHPTKSELDLYLDEVKFPSFQKFDLLDWWRFNTKHFPTLERMARDFLSIRITIPKDHLNRYSCICNYCRKFRFDSDTVNEAVICSKDWLKSYEFE